MCITVVTECASLNSFFVHCRFKPQLEYFSHHHMWYTSRFPSCFCTRQCAIVATGYDVLFSLVRHHPSTLLFLFLNILQQGSQQTMSRFFVVLWILCTPCKLVPFASSSFYSIVIPCSLLTRAASSFQFTVSVSQCFTTGQPTTDFSFFSSLGSMHIMRISFRPFYVLLLLFYSFTTLRQT